LATLIIIYAVNINKTNALEKSLLENSIDDAMIEVVVIVIRNYR